MCCDSNNSAPAAPAPDPGIGEAAKANAKISADWLQFSKDTYAESMTRQDKTDAINTRVVNQQLQSQDEANAWAKQDRARTLGTFQPVEDAFVKTAQGYDSPEKQAEAAAIAKADVLASSDVQRQMNQRQMASMGVDPTSGRFAGIARTQDTNAALASAGAQNNARQVVRDKGLALKADAINMGKGLASSTAAAYGIGTNSGNAAVGNNASANGQFAQAGQGMNQGFSGAIGGNSSSASILNNLYGNQVSAWSAGEQAKATSSAGTGAMVGSLASTGATLFL